MKKTLFGMAILAFTMVFASSYTNKPLFGTQTNQDNTGRQLTYGAASISDTAGSTIDTITILPDNYDKYYTLNLADSAVIAIKGTRSSFTYSHLHFIVTTGNITNANVKFLGYSGLSSQWLPSTTGTSKLSVAANGTSTISWICTGTKYAEVCRSSD